jgi:hypothetical protein
MTRTNKYGIMRTIDEDGYTVDVVNDIHDGKNFFRKMAASDSDSFSLHSKNEQELCKILEKNPHLNIVTFFEITDSYIDMELLTHVGNNICEK